MAIDLTSRIIQPVKPNAPISKLRWHPVRRLIQILCGILLVGLPLTNGMRLDVRKGVFYFAWHQTSVNDMFLLMWVALLGVWALMTVSVLHGRLWCGWVCPQTLASDFADSLKKRLDKLFHARPGKPAYIVSRGIWSVLLLAMSLGTGIIVACYWLAPATVWSAAWRPLADIPAGLTVYGITALLAADMLWVRRKFCTDVCPYGPLMGSLMDTKTLAARYLDERDSDCIRCGQCVASCPTGIDIKQGISQMSCIGCGECVDACNDVLGPRGKPGLIEFRYGTDKEYDRAAMSLAQRWGLWDQKRYWLGWGLPATVAVIIWLIYGPGPVTASVEANGAITELASEVRNTYTLTIDNGAPRRHEYHVTLSGLASGRLESPGQVISVDARAARVVPITVVCPESSIAPGARRQIRIQISDPGAHIEASTIFFRPVR